MLYCIHLMSTKERYNYKKGIYLFLTLDSGVIGVVGALSHSSFSPFLSPSPSPSFSPSNPLPLFGSLPMPDFSSRVKGSVTDVFRIVSSVSSMVVSCTVLAATEVVTELRDWGDCSRSRSSFLVPQSAATCPIIIRDNLCILKVFHTRCIIN